MKMLQHTILFRSSKIGRYKTSPRNATRRGVVIKEVKFPTMLGSGNHLPEAQVLKRDRIRQEYCFAV